MSSDESTALPTIPPEQFFAVDIRVGRIVACEPFPEARVPAYKLRIDFGPLGERRSSARLTQLYSPDELVGTPVLAVVNFPARQVGPVRSEVLVLGVYQEGGDRVTLVRPDHPCRPGDRLG